MSDDIQDEKNNWPSTRLVKVEDIRNTIDELIKKQWVCRGQQQCDDKWLLASIDRSNFQILDRQEKLKHEKESIRQFRENYQPNNENEKYWIQNSDILALAMMQHYSIPTRLLDWTYDPKVALLFAIDTKNGAANKDGKFGRLIINDILTKHRSNGIFIRKQNLGENLIQNYQHFFQRMVLIMTGSFSKLLKKNLDFLGYSLKRVGLVLFQNLVLTTPYY